MARPKNTQNCGNFTHTGRNPEEITAAAKKHSEEITGYKQFAAARRAARKYKQENTGVMLESVKEYISRCQDHREPLTIAGMMLAAGINKDFLSKATAGEYDHLLEEYIILNHINIDEAPIIDGFPVHQITDADTGEIRTILLVPYSDLVEKFRLLLQDQLERNCYTNKGNPAGSIFGLKAKFDWRDDPAPQHVENTLIIADKEQAQKALKMLENG